MKTNKLALLIGSLLSTHASMPFAASSIAYDNEPLTQIYKNNNSGYHEFVYFSDSNSNIVQEYLSKDTHEFPRSFNHTFYNDINTDHSTASAIVNSRDIPYAKTSAKSGTEVPSHTSDGPTYGGGSAYAEVGYRLDIHGLANEIVPINFRAAYELNGISQIGSPKSSAYSEVGLKIIELFNPNQPILFANTFCDPIIGSYCDSISSYDAFGSGVMSPVSGFFEGVGLLSFNDSHTSSSYKSAFNGTVNVQLDERGIGTMLIGIYALSNTSGDSGINQFSIANAYIDPFFTIDESYLALNPSTSILLPEGVGNNDPLNATNAVPEPETYFMLLAGLALLAASRRRRFTFANLKTT